MRLYDLGSLYSPFSQNFIFEMRRFELIVCQALCSGISNDTLIFAFFRRWNLKLLLNLLRRMLPIRLMDMLDLKILLIMILLLVSNARPTILARAIIFERHVWALECFDLPGVLWAHQGDIYRGVSGLHRGF